MCAVPLPLKERFADKDAEPVTSSSANGDVWPPKPTLPPAKVKTLLACVKVTSPLLKLTTEPEARNKSLHIKADVPSAAPSLVVGDAVSEKVIAEDPESITTFPVVEFPSVKVCMFVVPKTPVPVSVVALLPELALIVAVGVPPAIFMKAIFAEDVLVAPSKMSSVIFVGLKA